MVCNTSLIFFDQVDCGENLEKKSELSFRNVELRKGSRILLLVSVWGYTQTWHGGASWVPPATLWRMPVLIFKNIFMCMYECLPICMCTPCVPGTYGGQKRVSDLWNWIYSWLWTTMLVLWTKPRSSVRVASTLNLWDNSPSSPYTFFFILSVGTLYPSSQGRRAYGCQVTCPIQEQLWVFITISRRQWIRTGTKWMALLK